MVQQACQLSAVWLLVPANGLTLWEQQACGSSGVHIETEGQRALLPDSTAAVSSMTHTKHPHVRSKRWQCSNHG